MKKIAVITTSKELKEFQERTDIRILDINAKACDQTWATQEYFVATIVYDDDLNSAPDYWEKLKHQYAGMATADRKWYDMEKRLPIPTDGDDFLVRVENCEEQYAYAWYAYDRQCFMCYATGLSLGTAVRYYKPIIAPMYG